MRYLLCLLFPGLAPLLLIALQKNPNKISNDCFEKIKNSSFECKFKDGKENPRGFEVKVLGFHYYENFNSCSREHLTKGESIIKTISENLTALGAAQLSECKRVLLAQCITKRLIDYNPSSKAQHICTALSEGKGKCLDISRAYIAIASAPPLCLQVAKASGQGYGTTHAFNLVAVDKKIFFINAQEEDGTLWELPATPDPENPKNIIESKDVDKFPPPIDVLHQDGFLNKTFDN